MFYITYSSILQQAKTVERTGASGSVVERRNCVRPASRYTLDGIKTITTYDLTGCWMHCALPVGWACVRVSPSDGSPDILVENGVFFFATVIPCPVTDVEMARKPGTIVFQAGEIRGGVVIDDVPTSQYVFKNSCFRFCDDGCCSCKVTP